MSEAAAITSPVENNTDTVQATVFAVTLDLVQDWGLDLDDGVTVSTSLVKELEFASVDIIQLCVALEQHFKQKFGFQRLLMQDGSYVGDLTLGQLSDFSQSNLSQNH